MTLTSTPICAAAISLLTAALLLRAQTAIQPAQQAVPAPAVSSPAPTPRPSSNRNNNLFLDAAHGGADDGARIGDRLLEKDLTLALLGRIRTQIGEQPNLNVIVTRELEVPGVPAADTPRADLSNNSRAGMANHGRPFGGVLLHATAAGAGVHVVTSELLPPDPNAAATPGTNWATAQASWVRQSLRLANQVGIALQHAGVPVYLTHASVRPLDSLQCPAIAIELAPPRQTADPSTIADPSYQQRVATAIATALVSWRAHTEAAGAVAAPSSPAAGSKPEAGAGGNAVSGELGASQPRPETAPSATPRPRPARSAPAPIVRRAQPQQPPAAPIIRQAPPPASQQPEPQPATPPPGARP